MCAVSEVEWDDELIFGALTHKLHSLCPSRDDLIQTEDSRFVAVVRAVEFDSVKKSSFIMALYLVRCRRFLAGSLCNDLVLESAWKCHDSFLLCIEFEERLSFVTHGCAHGLCLRFLLCFDLREIFVEKFACLLE